MRIIIDESKVKNPRKVAAIIWAISLILSVALIIVNLAGIAPLVKNNGGSSSSKYGGYVDYGTMFFGSYPQSDVTSSISSTLSGYAINKPTNGNNYGWTSYGYDSSEYMWYKDVSYSGEKYRAVYFTSYRPYHTGYSSSADNSYQDDNGYYTSCVYWFKYEPIKWKILEKSNGKATILADIIIDSQKYNTSSDSGAFFHNGGTGCANNYALSNIRKWLNDTFYNTAFMETEKLQIETVTVDNSGNSDYSCANTQDKVYLLSMQEAITSAYGFNESSSKNDNARKKKTSSYAQCQGAYTTYGEGIYYCNGYWWLRSPSSGSPFYSKDVSVGGNISNNYVHSTGYGVVPALQITL